ncbi:hypothetical protein [Methylogaea oryzae]|uniref:Uncharacterized protein n=1 Tax=Methylogaea oryzae TaxID=1295382 RepID=A0A8D4VUP9_9GAMM|nr:hypothetical protein [Methylogaea oryzae]BBL72610.1 hypothetical protein MoryE10_32160 [Methylogaea oryzae]
MDNPPFSITPCGCRRGVFLVTPCANAAAGQCGRCGIPLCSEHARHLAQDWLCPACYAGQAGDSGDGTTTTSYGDTFSTGASDLADPFSEEDYAAFDAVSDFDKNAGDGHGYDS